MIFLTYSAAIVLSISIFFVLISSFSVYLVENDLATDHLKIVNLSKKEAMRGLSIMANLFFILILVSSITLYMVEQNVL